MCTLVVVLYIIFLYITKNYWLLDLTWHRTPSQFKSGVGQRGDHSSQANSRACQEESFDLVSIPLPTLPNLLTSPRKRWSCEICQDSQDWMNPHIIRILYRLCEARQGSQGRSKPPVSWHIIKLQIIGISGVCAKPNRVFKDVKWHIRLDTAPDSQPVQVRKCSRAHVGSGSRPTW